jgi:uncharacterized membrane protein
MGITDTISKKVLEQKDALAVAWLRYLFMMIIVAPYLLAFGTLRLSGPNFWFPALIIVPLDISATIIYLNAIKMAPLSLTLPFLAFTPFFTMVISWLVLGERISQVSFLGVLLIVTGGYLLNAQKITEGIWAPFKAIWDEKAPRLILLVTLLFSISTVFGKMAVLRSSPNTMIVIYPVSYFIGISLVFLTYLRSIKPGSFTINNSLYLLAIIGALDAISMICHFQAISLIEISLMMSIKRLNILFGVVLGFIFFKEKQFWRRLPATLLMLSGAILITLL